jgi:Tfp pilus assembly protein PilO
MKKITFLQSKQLQTNIYIGLCAVILVIIGYYTYTNLTKFLGMREEISINETLHGSLVDTDKRVADELQKVNQDNSALKQKIQNELELVLPVLENHTILTRALEKFETDTNRVKDPFNISNLQYLTVTKVKDANYQALPIRMTINSSYNNFFKFLEYVGNSGALSDGSRLLDIQSITINFVNPKGSPNNVSGQDEINFNVSMNAYLRTN